MKINVVFSEAAPNFHLQSFNYQGNIYTDLLKELPSLCAESFWRKHSRIHTHFTASGLREVKQEWGGGKSKV